jgi:hypothetical protein
MKNNDLAARISAAKEKVRIADAWTRLGLPNPPRAGNVCVRSPFRTEKNASFGIFAQGRAFKDHANDEAKGDVIDFIRLATHCSKREAITTLLEWAGDHEPLGHRRHTGKIILPSSPVAVDNHPATTPEAEVVPSMVDAPADALPPEENQFKHTRRIIPGSVNAIRISASRGLPHYALDKLAEAGIIQTYEDGEQWVLVDGPKMPHEAVTAEFRRYDRAVYKHGAKAHTCKGFIKGWPMALSLAMKDPSQTIIIVEGGPDLLAAYALIEHLSRHDCVAIAILGREIMRLIPEAQRALAGRCVHIIPHRDKGSAGELTSGRDAAVKWTDMFMDDCGVTDVTWSSLEGLTRPDGRPATDLCEAVEDGGIERNGAHWDDLMPDRNEQEAEASTISKNGF